MNNGVFLKTNKKIVHTQALIKGFSTITIYGHVSNSLFYEILSSQDLFLFLLHQSICSSTTSSFFFYCYPLTARPIGSVIIFVVNKCCYVYINEFSFKHCE